MNKEEQEVLAKKSSEASYSYCLKNKEANISLHEDIICKSNNAHYIYFFAKNIKGANINKLEEAIIKSNNVDCIYAFAKDIEGANVKRLEEAVIKSNHADYIYRFAVDIEEANINKLEDAIIKTNDASYIYSFAKDIEGANINKLEEAIIKYNDIHYTYWFAKNIKGANLDKFKDILENSEYKEKFAELYSEYKSNLIASKFVKEKDKTINRFDIEFFTKNFAEGAYAGAANEVVNNLAKSLIIAIKASGMDDGSVKIIEDGMNSQIGKICLAIMVGAGIKLIPIDILQNNKSLQKVAEKCVENAGSQGTQFAFNGAMNILLPALLGAIQDNPQLKLVEQVGTLTAPTKARVESNVKDLADDLSEEEANAFNEEFAKKKAKSGLNK